MTRAQCLPILAAWLAAAPALAQTGASAPPEAFPFVIPWDDATLGTATDVSALNARPAGANGRIVAKGGHLAELKTGKRVRFLAVNFAAKSAFPSHADAEKVAARLAKLGINLVRLHHLDNDWSQDSTLIDLSRPDHRHILPSQLDRLDYLIAQFEQHGIYVNINLHIARTLSEADGLMPGAKEIKFSFDKRVDYFDRTIIARQKEYARDLLTHVNPYTRRPYTTDPGVLVVELTNEDSLVGDPWAKYGQDLDTLPAAYREELRGQWNEWLTQRYRTDSALKAAWRKGVTPLGAPLLSAQNAWTTESQGTSVLTSEPGAAGTVAGAPSQAFHIARIDDTDWHVQSHITGMNLAEGATYTVTFQAKADAARTLPVAASLDQSDWHGVGLTANADLTTDWKSFRYIFTAKNVVPGHARIAFTLGGKTGTVEIRGLQIRPGIEEGQFSAGQTLEAKRLPIPTPETALPPQWADWLLFLSDTERHYADEMSGYLRKTLGLQANLVCSQISWGGVLGLRREAGMDIADNHAYWQHPEFPHQPWDPKDWRIPNTSMVTALAHGQWNTLTDLAQYRVLGKPYTISEYNHPAPNDFQAETVPLIATFGAFQDWDALYLFDYGDYGTGAKNDQINGYFGIGSNPAKTAFLPAAAWIFRLGAVPIAKSQVVQSIAVADALGKGAADVWSKGQTHPVETSLSARLAMLSTSRTDAPALAPHPSPLSVQSGVYRVDAANAQALVGVVGGGTQTLGPVTYQFPKFGNGFAAVTLTPLDGEPIARSKRLLHTLVGKVENQEMHWNADRTSIADQWGHGPTMAEGIPATVGIASKSLHHVYALDGTGNRTQEVPTVAALDGTVNFTTGPKYATLWYEITE